MSSKYQQTCYMYYVTRCNTEIKRWPNESAPNVRNEGHALSADVKNSVKFIVAGNWFMSCFDWLISPFSNWETERESIILCVCGAYILYVMLLLIIRRYYGAWSAIFSSVRYVHLHFMATVEISVFFSFVDFYLVFSWFNDNSNIYDYQNIELFRWISPGLSYLKWRRFWFFACWLHHLCNVVSSSRP